MRDTKQKYSAWTLLQAAASRHRQWAPAWREARPKPAYDVIIVGGGGHGLATAYYLAKNHGLTNVAVLERGWIGGGNTGRNTTIVRSNYLYPESARLYDFSLQLYENLSQALNFNIMLSQRGLIVLAHSRHDLESMSRWANAMRMNGIDADLLTREQVQHLAPDLDMSGNARYPILGGLTQARAGTARHDAVAWGYARAASALGSRHHSELRGTWISSRRAVRSSGVDTNLGRIRAGNASASPRPDTVRCSPNWRVSNCRSRAIALQAMVSEPVKPMLDTVILSAAIGSYVSQSDKGEMVMGGGARFVSLLRAARQLCGHARHPCRHPGVVPLLQPLAAAAPMGRHRRCRAGLESRSSARTPIKNLYINCGWGTGGFKAIPVGGWTLAHVLATGQGSSAGRALSARSLQHRPADR